MTRYTPKHAVITAIGALLFFLLGRFVIITSPIDTVNICIQYGLLAYVSVVFGPLIGCVSGLLGHILIDWSWGEFCWSWIIATAAFGALLGVLANVIRLQADEPDRTTLIHFNLCQVAVHVVCWAGIAPVLEILFYAESMDRIFEQGLSAAIANATTTAIVGSALLLLHSAAKSRAKA